MIAYFIKLATLCFGDTLFALSVVGIVVMALTSRIIYKTARLCMGKEASYVAMLLWLFSPLVTLDIVNQTTYDTPLSLFWALTVYFAVKYIKHNQLKDLYWIGACVGLMLLSKYSGVVLLLGLFIFLMSTRYRSLFKSYHLYLSLLLSIIIFSPVIFWNYQHHWTSFLYQLSHHLSHEHFPIQSGLNSFFTIFVPSLNFLLLSPIVYWLRSSPKKDLSLYLCLVVCLTFLVFYILFSGGTIIRGFWLTQYLITASLLAGFCYQEYQFYKSTKLLISVYVVASIIILIANTTQFSFNKSKKLSYYREIEQINSLPGQLPKFVLSPNWSEARILFFLKNKPLIYSVKCGPKQNQYAYWSAEIQGKMHEKSIKSALYIDLYNRKKCVEQYFDRCEPMILPRKEPFPVFIYRCVND